VATKEELLERITEGDDSAIEELKVLLDGLENEGKTAKRDLKLKTDKTLRERYPRALRVFDMGRFPIDAGLSDDELAKALEDKENELAELGVPLSTEPAPAAKEEPKGEEVPAKVTEGDTDPAAAMSGAGGNSSPGGAARDEVREIVEQLKQGSTLHDQAKAFTGIAQLNKDNQKAKLKEITDLLAARPIER